MTDLRSAAEQLRQAHAHALGALDSAQRGATGRRDAAARAAQRDMGRQESIARNQASQAVIQHSLRARDLATSLNPRGADPLDVAEYVTLGHLAAPGSPSGVNEDVTAPCVVPLLGRGNLIIQAEPAAARRLVETLVSQSLRGTAPGQLDVVGYDPDLTSVLAPFSPLRRTSEEALQVLNRPEELQRKLQDLTADVRRVKETMRAISPRLVDFRRSVGHPIERFQLVVLFDYPTSIDEPLHRQLLAIANAGPDAGMSFVFVFSPNRPKPDWWSDEDLRGLGNILREDHGVLRWSAHPAFELMIPDHGPGAIASVVDKLVSRANTVTAPQVSFKSIQPDEPMWQSSSADRLEFAIGVSGLDTVEVTLGDNLDQRHNILITGAVGQGKSNLLKVIIHSLARRYSPEELELYLLDFKEGVTLYPLAATPGSPDFLPHARILGLESDRDFGLAVLRHIEAEFARRAKLFRPYGDSIASYRAAVPGAPMARIVLVIDEFHMLFDPNDKTAEAAAQLLEGIARRGRSYGIHLVLASQTISGISALMTREGGIFAQFPLRLALKNAVQESFAVLGQGNDAAARLRARGQAVLNPDYGQIDSNRMVTIAVADDAELARLRQTWWKAARANRAAPLVFDGSKRIGVADAVESLRAARRASSQSAPATAFVGYPIDVSGTPLAIPLGAEPGRHLAILGAGEPAPGPEEGEGPANNAIGVLQCAAVSLALQHPEGDAQFVSFEMLDENTLHRNNHQTWHELMATIGYAVERIGRDEIADYLQSLAADIDARDAFAPPTYLLGFGLDRATTLDTPDMFAHRPSEDLQQVLRAGPAKGIHLLGWWANAATFKAHIGFGGEGFIDALLMLRIDQSSVQEMLSSPFISWSVRDNRGLLSDRTQLPEPTSIIPFSPVTVRDAAAMAKTDWEV